MLAISRNSWHYKLVSAMLGHPLWWDSPDPPYYRLENIKNLCMYGRRVLLALFVFAPAYVFLLPGVFVTKITARWGAKYYRFYGWVIQTWFTTFLGILLMNYLVAPYPSDKIPPVLMLLGGFLFSGIVLSGLLAFVLLCSGAVWVIEKWENMPASSRKPRGMVKALAQKVSSNTGLDLAWAWLKAQKQKICPRIQFVD